MPPWCAGEDAFKICPDSRLWRIIACCLPPLPLETYSRDGSRGIYTLGMLVARLAFQARIPFYAGTRAPEMRSVARGIS